MDDQAIIDHLERYLTDTLPEKLGRSRVIVELSQQLGKNGTLMPGGEIAWIAWNEARWSFIHGHHLAAILLAQSLAEHMLGGWLRMSGGSHDLPDRLTFAAAIRRCLDYSIIDGKLAQRLGDLAVLRNSLIHFRGLDDPSSLGHRVSARLEPAFDQLAQDAEQALNTIVSLLACPAFRVG
ncbi:MAG: hypothetical protein V4618_15625 [Pseudomonadota bacterium]